MGRLTSLTRHLRKYITSRYLPDLFLNSLAILNCWAWINTLELILSKVAFYFNTAHCLFFRGAIICLVSCSIDSRGLIEKDIYTLYLAYSI